jgi:putative transcriptional regulator
MRSVVPRLAAALAGVLLSAALPLAGAPPTAQITGLAGSPPGSLAGELLVATPELHDPHFQHTVVYLVRHDPGGAMGVIVNRPIGDVPLAALLERAGLDARGSTGALRLHRGGPVEPTRVFALHSDDYAASGTVPLGEGLALTWQADILRALAAGGGPRRAVFAVGYAGWAPGQLEDEIKAGAWVSVPADLGLLFDDSSDTKWDRAYARHRITL